MVLSRARHEQIHHSFMDGLALQFRDALGIPGISLKGIEQRFRLWGLSRAIRSTAHWASWRAVGDEYPAFDGTRKRGVGFRVATGTGEDEVRFVYYPSIVGRGPMRRQSSELQVWGGAAQEQVHPGFFARDAFLSHVTAIGRMLKFSGRIVTPDGKLHHEMWIRPARTGQGFIFQLGSGGSFSPDPGRLFRLGGNDAVVLPGLGVPDAQGDIVYDDMPQGFPGRRPSHLREFR